MLLLPTASDDLLGGKKWCVGPPALALVQQNGWPYGALVNHLWCYATLSRSRRTPEVGMTTGSCWSSRWRKATAGKGINLALAAPKALLEALA